MEPFANLPPVHQGFAAKADSSRPELRHIEQSPVGLISVEKDESAPLKWKQTPAGSVTDQKVLTSGDSVILDFGGHRTGYLSFRLQPYKHGFEPADSPCRLQLIFGEILKDVAEDFEPYNAWLSKSWLPDEIITVDYLPQLVKIPRRHAFRFVKFNIIATSRRYGVKIEGPIATAVTSAPAQDPPPLSFSRYSQPLTEDEKRLLRSIDKAALLTLRNCMQTVYEDGPRRDMRLWLGDLRLQALTNYGTFGDFKLAKRCLYLFAATPFNEDNLLSASCYEKPHTCSGGQSIVDFAQLYAPALLDYVEASGDEETGHELFAIALKQFELSLGRLDPATSLYAGISASSDDTGEAGGDVLWHFIDWQATLDKTTASHGVIIFGLRAILSLAKRLNMPPPTILTPLSSEPINVEAMIERLVSAARTHYFDNTQGLFVSGPSRQVSWASNAWAVLAGIPKSQDQAATALRNAYANEEAVIGKTPYLHHYLVEAFIKAGLRDHAKDHILKYWGSMVEAGADTFWEIWDPKDPEGSPYGDIHSNS